jgi:hypothetical protein
MRTAIIMYMNNPLRMEDWRQMVLGVLMPPMLLLMLLGNTTTWLCIQLSREARRGLKLGRDHVADGEAIRVSRGIAERDRKDRRPRRFHRQPSRRRHAVRRESRS